MLGVSLGVAPARAAVGNAVAAGSTFPVEGIDVERAADKLVVYTPASGTTSPANQWGAEAAVVNGTVTEVRDRQSTGQSGQPVPASGAVLSGHGAARVWLLAHVTVGAAVSYPGQSTATPPPPPLPPGSATATLSGATHVVSGTDVTRVADALVVYTALSGPTSPANQWGFEAAVTNGVVTATSDRQTTGAPGTAVPSGGYVLSGHGTSRSWLLANARVGVAASLSGTGPPATPVPHGSSCAAGFVRLTFDDGPHATITPQVLDTLRAWNVRATFFVVGGNIKGLEQLLRREVAEGHVIGNHTFDHVYMTTLSAAAQRDQLQRTTDAIVAAGAPRPTLWRPPYEDWNAKLQALATGMGLTMTLWSYETDSNDWQGLSPEAIRDRVVGNAHDGAVVLMHDRIQNSATALPLVLDGLANKGLCTRL